MLAMLQQHVPVNTCFEQRIGFVLATIGPLASDSTAADRNDDVLTFPIEVGLTDNERRRQAVLHPVIEATLMGQSKFSPVECEPLFFRSLYRIAREGSPVVLRSEIPPLFTSKAETCAVSFSSGIDAASHALATRKRRISPPRYLGIG